MIEYICVKCKKEFVLEDRIRCPHCGFRIIAKKRPIFKKKLKAR